MKNTHPLEAIPDRTPAIAAASFIALITFAGLWWLLHRLVPPVAWDIADDAPVAVDIGVVLVIAREILGEAFSPDTFLRVLDAAARLPNLLMAFPGGLMTWLTESEVLLQCLSYLASALIAAQTSARIVYHAVERGLVPRRQITTVSGQEPLYAGLGARHVNEAWRDRLMAVGRGIFLAPGVIMPRDVETEHVCVMGTTGAGKSTIIEGLLKQGMRRGDRALIVDVKGDARQRFDMTAAGELSLQGSGSSVWAIGRDIRTRQDAIELASVLIPGSKDPIWSDGARLYLVGLIVALQQRSRKPWGWGDLRDMLAKPFHEQEGFIRKSMPDIVNLLQSKDGDPTATVMSILVTTVANVGSIAWSLSEREKEGGHRLSLRSWATGRSKLRVIFLRLEFDRESQSAALLKLALRCTQAALLGSQVRDGVDHAIWFGLDELPRFCDDQTVERLVALGRSRGVRIAAALQVPAQLRRSIGADATDALLGNFGLQIISRVAPGPSRGEIARDWLGSRMVTWKPAPANGEAAQQTPLQEFPVLTPGELTGTLGKFYSARGKPFIRAAVTGFNHVPILDWPTGWADKL